MRDGTSGGGVGRLRGRRPAASPVFALCDGDVTARPAPVDLLFRRPIALLSLVPRPVVIFAAGAFAGALGKVVIAPLDRVKILLQVKGGLQGGVVRAAAAKGGVLRSLKAIAQEEGILSFWKGSLPQVLRVIPYSAVQLGSYEALKHLVRGKDGEPPVVARLFAGAGAGLLATLVTYPLDTLRFRLAIDPNVRTVQEATGALVREGGVPALFRGLGPALVGIAPYMALELASFDLLPHELPSFARGFAAALIATSFCYPLDTVRRQIQLNSEHGLPVAKVVKSIVDEEGVRGLYRGFLPNAIKNLPNKGVRLSTFAAVKSLQRKSEVAYREEVELERSKAKARAPQEAKLNGHSVGALGTLASVSHDRNQAS